jgi:RNA polymerase sigma-70 factor (ECF subfamily)
MLSQAFETALNLEEGLSSSADRVRLLEDEERQERQREDRQLLAAVARGEAAALDALYARYASRLYPMARRILADEGDAEDCLIDVFVEIWERPERYDSDRASPGTYLNMLTRSRAIDRLRARERRRRGLDTMHREALPILGEREESALDALVEAQNRQRFERALRELDPGQRVPIELVYFEGLTQTEVAERLGAPLGTVKNRTRRGLARLRRLLRRGPREGTSE